MTSSKFFLNKTILITGGTGSFGKEMVKTLLELQHSPKKIIIFSRDELKQFEMQNIFSGYKNFKILRFFIGDIRDLRRLQIAFNNVDFVIHAAALKQVPAAEYNPFEFIKTNVMGAQNIIEASLNSPSISRVVALSTDKAASPTNLYGATKLCSDKIFVAGNNYVGQRNLNFSVVRYGNVMGSRGSVIPYFLELAKKNSPLPITHNEMTRFNISLSDGVKMVLWALEHAKGSEIIVPKLPSYRILDLANAIAPDSEKNEVGIRAGEKIHELMISESDSYNTVDLGNYFIILPLDNTALRDYYLQEHGGNPFPAGEIYQSGTNQHFLSVNELRDLINKLD